MRKKGGKEAPSHRSGWEVLVLGSSVFLGVFVTGTKGRLEGRQLPLGSCVACPVEGQRAQC